MTRKTPALVLFAVLAFVALARPASAADVHAAPSPSAAVADDFKANVPGATALEGRILAPCCWNQTVDIHGSEVSNAIRREIRSRLRSGESAEAIQASLVQRYGAKILAMQSDSALPKIALTVLIVMGAAGAAGFSMLRRWRRRGTSSKPRSKEKRDEATEERLDARLDAELRALDD